MSVKPAVPRIRKTFASGAPTAFLGDVRTGTPEFRELEQTNPGKLQARNIKNAVTGQVEKACAHADALRRTATAQGKAERLFDDGVPGERQLRSKAISSKRAQHYVGGLPGRKQFPNGAEPEEVVTTRAVGNPARDVQAAWAAAEEAQKKQRATVDLFLDGATLPDQVVKPAQAQTLSAK